MFKDVKKLSQNSAKVVWEDVVRALPIHEIAFPLLLMMSPYCIGKSD